MIAASILLGRALAPVEQSIGAWKNLVAARDARDRLSALFERLPPAPAGMRLPAPRRPAELRAGRLCAARAERSRSCAASASRSSRAAPRHRRTVGRRQVDARARSWSAPGSRPAAARAWMAPTSLAWNADLLGRHVGYLPQDVELFAGTVAENIARLGTDPDPEAVVAAARTAGVHEMILRPAPGLRHRDRRGRRPSFRRPAATDRARPRALRPAAR